MRRKLLILAFFIVFMFLGIMALQQGKPSVKNERVYSLIQEHIPYTLEKRVGGYSILSTQTGIKEKPPAKDLFLRLEQLERQWAQDFLKLEENSLMIFDKDKNEIIKIELKTQEEKDWVKSYFEIN